MAPPSKWTDEKEDFLIKHYHKLALKELEAKLGIHQTNISIRAKALGLSKRTYVSKLLPGEDFEIIKINGEQTRYAISNHGRVVNLENTNQDGHFLLLQPKVQRRIDKSKGGSGYLQVCLSLDGEDLNLYIHRLVAEYFVHTDKDGNPLTLKQKLNVKEYEVNHKDSDKKNNHAKNLEYVSHSYNVKHMHEAKKHASFR